jgi:hypothetical protein
VRMEGGGPFPGLEKEVVSLTVAGGAAVLVDLEGVVLFWYFPNYIGQGLQVRSNVYCSGLCRDCAYYSSSGSFWTD